ncbi:MAG: hypothetical protein U0800_18505 [Isosphaeraceae bacterium]
MRSYSENEGWIVEAGDTVITKQAGGDRLSPAERLIYCLWVADYGMRNAGDLDTAHDVYPKFQREAFELAGDLGLQYTRQSFGLPTETLQAEYFERFDCICTEIQGIYLQGHGQPT